MVMGDGPNQAAMMAEVLCPDQEQQSHYGGEMPTGVLPPWKDLRMKHQDLDMGMSIRFQNT
jgi:hypothetical protein